MKQGVERRYLIRSGVALAGVTVLSSSHLSIARAEGPAIHPSRVIGQTIANPPAQALDYPKGWAGREGSLAAFPNSERGRWAPFLDPNAHFSRLQLRQALPSHDSVRVSEMLSRWRVEVRDNDTWYNQVVKDMRALAVEGRVALETAAAIDDFFEGRLREDGVKLGNRVHNWDKLRKPLDRMVIHHSAGPDDVSDWMFSAWGLTNIYAPDYHDNQKTGDLEKDPDRDFLGEDITREPIETSHFMWMSTDRVKRGILVPISERRQVAPSYHWKVNTNGEPGRMLEDEHLGFHALGGNNGSSIAVVLNGDFSGGKTPSEKALEAIVDIYMKYRDQISPDKIFGHRELPGNNTICPGDTFLDGWKPTLLKMIKDRLPPQAFISLPNYLSA